MAKGLRAALFSLAMVAALLQPTECRAQDCGTWVQDKVGLPSGSQVAYGNGATVILGTGGSWAQLENGPWRWAQAPVAASAASLAWGAGRFVGVGGQSISVSDDGLSWRQVASPDAYLSDVAWNGSVFAAVSPVEPWEPSPPAVVMTSPDGLQWSTTPLASGVNIQAIVWGGGQWIGLGSGLFISPDAVNWTQRVSGIFFGAAGWNGSQYLAIGSDNAGNDFAAMSADGVHWTVRASTLSAKGHLASDGHTWVAPGPTGVSTSTDGQTWSQIRLQPSMDLPAVLWTGSRFVAVGSTGLATSADGTVWSTEPVVDLNATIWAGDHFVAVGQVRSTGQGVAYLSADGLAWTPATLPPGGPTVALAWTGSQLVAVGPQGGVYTSPTGDVWTRRTVPAGVATASLASVAWNGSTLVVVGDEAALVSTDGAEWNAVSLPGTFFLGATWGAGEFVAVGYSPADWSPYPDQHVILASPDGLDWTLEVAGIACASGLRGSSLAGVAWSGTRFVAVGACLDEPISVCYTSTDRIAWSPEDSCPGMSAVFWTGSAFYTFGAGVSTSTDGLNWNPDPQFLGPANDVAGNGKQLVAVGPSGETDQMDCTAPPPIGEPGVSNAVIATAAHTPGLAGTQWVTDVELFDPASDAATAVLYYLPRGADNTVATRRVVTVPAGQAVRLADVVGQLFGLTGSAGALVVSSSQPLLVTSRTSTGSSAGTLGQFVPGLPATAALAAGQEGRLIQLSENASYRTNVGFASVSAAPTSVTVTLYRVNGGLLGALPVTLPPFGSAQVTEILPEIGVASVDDAFAVVRSDTPGAQYVAYASVVDNVSGDPLTVLPVRASSSQPLYLPAVAHNPGLKGTVWRTDLEVANPGAAPAAYRIELLKTGQDNTTPAAATYTLDPGTSRRYLDVVSDIFGFAGSGAIRVTPTAGAVMATARSYTDTGSGSRGQFIPAVPLSQAIAAGTSGRLIQLTSTAGGASGFRTNVGFVNATASPITVQADLYSATGAWLGARFDTLAPYEFTQDTGIFATVTTSDVADGFAVLTSGTAGAQFFAYASVIDNLSGAPVYVPAQ